MYKRFYDCCTPRGAVFGFLACEPETAPGVNAHILIGMPKGIFMLQVVRKHKSGLSGFVPIASSFALVGVLSLSGVAHADSTVTLNASVGEPELAINVSSSTVNLSVRPSTSGTGTASGNVTVTVGSPVTYNLYMYSNQTDLISSAGTTPINALSTSNCAAGNTNCTLTSNNFTNDTWGFNVNSNQEGVFQGFSGFETIASSVASSTTNTNVTFGVKVSTATNPGEYSNTLRFVAVTTAASSSTLEMQNMNINDCPANGRVLATDTRDYSVYNIQKLADGNCWMLDNLALGSTTTAYNLTPNDTNITANWTLPKSTAGTTGDSRWYDSYTDPYINAAGNCSTSTNTGSPDWGCSQSNREREGGYNKNSEVLYDSTYDTLNGNNKIGVYYNYCAASAGTYCRNSNGTSSSDEDTLSDNANGTRSISGDICPKGWRLPTGGSSGEFQALYAAYSNTPSTFRTALATPLSGLYWGGAAHDQGVYGAFWSSTRQSASYMCLLIVTASGVTPANNNIRYHGRSVRCVLAES